MLIDRSLFFSIKEAVVQLELVIHPYDNFIQPYIRVLMIQMNLRIINLEELFIKVITNTIPVWKYHIYL